MEKKKTGECWEIMLQNGETREAVILADHGGCSSILILTDNTNPYNDITVNCRGEKYASSQKVQYCFNSNIVTFIRTLSESEFASIMDKVAKSLGIKVNPVKSVEIVKKVPVYKEVPAQEAQVAQAAKADEGLAMELATAKAQLGVYKGLYEELLKGVLHG